MQTSNPVCVLWLNVLSSAMEDIKHYYRRKSPDIQTKTLKEIAMKWIYRGKGTFTQVAASIDKTPEELKEMCLAELKKFRKSPKGEKRKRRHPRH